MKTCVVRKVFKVQNRNVLMRLKRKRKQNKPTQVTDLAPTQVKRVLIDGEWHNVKVYPPGDVPEAKITGKGAPTIPVITKTTSLKGRTIFPISGRRKVRLNPAD